MQGEFALDGVELMSLTCSMTQSRYRVVPRGLAVSIRIESLSLDGFRHLLVHLSISLRQHSAADLDAF